MRVLIQHITEYEFNQPALLGPHVVRLHPAQHASAETLSYNLSVEPAGEVRWQFDPWNNRVVRLTFPPEPCSRLTLKVDAAFDIKPVNPFNFFIDDRCGKLPFRYPDGLDSELLPFLSAAAPGPRLAAWLAATPAEETTIDFLVGLNARAAKDIGYVIRNEPGIQTSEETLALGRGSCRDLALLLVDALRAHGLAARFTSGYLVQLTDESIIPDLAKGVAQDVADLHAWAEVFIPGGGWIGLDGTSGLLCGEGHIALASATEPLLAAPITGTTSEHGSMSFQMTVTRLGHEPRPRRPYTDEQWQGILDAGQHLDSELTRLGLRMTMGGEPTWTSREAPHEPEWCTEALGPTKRSQGLRMARQLRKRLGVGPVVLNRFGKWYPGESLPRWALDLIWRVDGTPVWKDAARLDLGDAREVSREERAAQLEQARRLGEAVARRLDVEPNLHEGYEDPWPQLLAEQDLPTDVDPLAADLDAPEERRRLARILQRGLGTVVGLAMPLGCSEDGRWHTTAWELRRERLYLIPGDSPMGLRLPLDRLAGEAPPIVAADPTALPPAFGFGPGPRARPSAQAPGRGGAVEVNPRTTLCVEPREGSLCVFLPPLSTSEQFLELLSVIEEAAAELDVAVRLEGYPPPSDPRLRECRVAPDPGVLEVNLPPCETFPAFVETVELISEAANHAGLRSERYMLDGREAGSGGGNHITLGGPTPLESPFLQRPDMLASLVRFIQNHPCMSYLFSGLFVGPTCEAPRVDEARHEGLYELELALTRLTAGDAQERAKARPWITDRALRNLLVDVGGNTHRTELCIDKLYSPDHAAGRQGLVELRAFEMPPSERMAVAQMLLVRALATRFAIEPYEQALVPWGTQLHDRWMLPYWLWRDLEDVVADLAAHGLPIESDQFRPFLDFRFGVAGRLSLEDIEVELRPALEPWPVLGEESNGVAVSRYVDSSLERLQVRVSGLVEGRHVVLVNGVRVPLQPTGTAGEGVAGVRFRAWQPPRCLQPEIGIHHPLRFDVVDTWAKRSLGACTYHVWHPEGRGFDTPPLTQFEAAARRAQRFTTVGHMAWPAGWIEPRLEPSAPYTLDLRRYPVDRPAPSSDD